MGFTATATVPSPDPNSNPPVIDLTHFLDAQNLKHPTSQFPYHALALLEMRLGQKRTHWIWWTLPTVVGISTTYNGSRYAIHSRAEALAYLRHPVLGDRLVEICDEILSSPEKNVTTLMTTPDVRKLKACATLFALVDTENTSLWRAILRKYFKEEECDFTKKVVERWV